MLAEFWARPAFSIRDVDFLWLDVALGAMARGQWPAFEQRLAQGLACIGRADAENALPSEEALDAAATAFRYDRDLIAAADVNAWLERTGIPADEWVAYLNRHLLRDQWSDDLDDILDRFSPSVRQLFAAAVAEGICSGSFDTHFNALAGRAAFVFENDPEQFRRVCVDREAPAPLAAAAADLAHTHAHWLSMWSAADSGARLTTVLQIESAFDALIDGVAANGRLREIVDANRLEWMRLELDTVSFPIEPAAREAILCIREDGLTLYDVAALSHRTVARKAMALEDIDPEHRDRLLAAEPGRIVGPLPVDDRFEVTALVSRTAATLADSAVAARARQALVDVTIQRAIRNHVTRPAVLSSGPHPTGGEAV
jgi:hypothetical protein